MGEGFSRQARQILTGIIAFISRKFNAAWREKTRPDGESRLCIQVLNHCAKNLVYQNVISLRLFGVWVIGLSHLNKKQGRRYASVSLAFYF
jgi:hypothetical protein